MPATAKRSRCDVDGDPAGRRLEFSARQPSGPRRGDRVTDPAKVDTVIGVWCGVTDYQGGDVVTLAQMECQLRSGDRDDGSGVGNDSEAVGDRLRVGLSVGAPLNSVSKMAEAAAAVGVRVEREMTARITPRADRP